jgi:hypothetical protein
MDDLHFEVGEFAVVMGPTEAEAHEARARAGREKLEGTEDTEGTKGTEDNEPIRDSVDDIPRGRMLDEVVAQEIFGMRPIERNFEEAIVFWGRRLLDGSAENALQIINVPHAWGAVEVWYPDGLPRFSTNIVAALAIFLRYQKGGWGGALVFDGHFFSDRFNASFGQNADATESHPAEAICRAAIRARRATVAGRPGGTMDRGAKWIR